MTNQTLALSYLRKASDRLEALDFFLKKSAYSDVVREAQECVELALKAMLRYVGVEPPKIHDVGALLLEHKEKFPENIQTYLDKIAEISKRLRKERELAFYGDVDFIPTENYTEQDATHAFTETQFVVEIARQMIREK